MIIIWLWIAFLLGFFAGCFWAGRSRVVVVRRTRTIQLPGSLKEFRRRREDLVS